MDIMKIDIDKIKEKKTIQELLEFSIINIDKPQEWTSFDVDNKIKKSLNLNKTSHFGTLDPMVTGVLPIALNRACKLLDYFMHRDKIYIGEMKIHKKISKKKLEEEMKKFVGKIMQKPPVKSRVKRVKREREIKKWELLNYNEKKGVAEFLAEVEAGTYIRKLCSDLGEKINGAHMTKLKRIKAGFFDEKNMVKMEDVLKIIEEFKKGDEKKLREILTPAEIVTKLYPVIYFKKTRISKILNGKPIIDKDLETGMKKQMKKIIEDSKNVFCGFSEDRFIGMYKKTKEENILARPLFVKN